MITKIQKILDSANLTIEDIRNEDKRENIAMVRNYIVYYLINLGYKRAKVAELVNRNRTNTYHSERVISDMIKTDYKPLISLINKMKTKQEKKISQEDILVNIYFMLMDATDILIRDIEIRLKRKYDTGLKNENKLYHNRMMQNIKVLKSNYEAYYTKTQCDIFSDKYDEMDDLRKSANLMIRIALLMSDRTYYDDTIEDKIEKLIEDFPDNGFVDKETIKKFIMR